MKNYASIIIAFILGLVVSAFYINNTNSIELSETTEEIINPKKELISAEDSDIKVKNIEKNDTSNELETLKKQNQQYADRLEKLQNRTQITPKINERIADIVSQLSKSQYKNKILMDKLKKYVPEGELDIEVVNDDELAKVLPEGFRSSKYMSEKFKQQILDFHQQPENLDKGYQITQQLTDFIQTHPEGYKIQIDSLTCKDSNCEIFITTKITRDTLKNDGYTHEQITEYRKNTTPPHKIIMKDLQLKGEIPVQNITHMAGDFSGYYFYKINS